MSNQRTRRVRGSQETPLNDKLSSEEKAAILADHYVNLRENEKLIGEKKKEIGAELQGIVQDIGESVETDKSEPNYVLTVKRGTKKITIKSVFVTSSSPVADVIDRLKKQIKNPRDLSKVIKTTEYVDYEALNKLVADEKLDADFVESLFEESRPYRRLDVK